MIKIHHRNLRQDDIGRMLSIEGYKGIVANFTHYKNHVEVVFEDGKRVEFRDKDELYYDDSIDVSLTCEELRAFIDYHPKMKNYKGELDQWEKHKHIISDYKFGSNGLSSVYYDHIENKPRIDKRLLDLKALLEQTERKT